MVYSPNTLYTLYTLYKQYCTTDSKRGICTKHTIHTVQAILHHTVNVVYALNTLYTLYTLYRQYYTTDSKRGICTKHAIHTIHTVQAIRGVHIDFD
jgi:acyl-CoA-binding protein